MVGHAPEQVTTDGHNSYPRAIRETIGSHVQHRTNTYLNNQLEQDHRGIKQRYYPMRGFGNVASATRFCRAFDARSSVLSRSDHYEAKGFPGSTTRGIPPAIGHIEDIGSGGVMEKSMRKSRACALSSFLHSQF